MDQKVGSLVSTLFDITSLLPIIEKQFTEGNSTEPQNLILTPNQRLTAKIQAAYALYQQELASTWRSANILPLSGWVERLWAELQDRYPAEYAIAVINSRQELILWEQIIAEDPNSSPLIKPSGLAKHCQQAFNTLQLWGISPNDTDYQQWSNESDPFPQWHQQYLQHCKANSFITTGEQIELITLAFTEGKLSPLNSIQLLGFQDVPPLHQQLLKAAAELYGEIELPSRNTSTTLLALNNAETELATAARWAKKQLTDTEGSIGIVIPDLHQRRDEVERVLRKHLEPSFLSLEDTNEIPSFNVSIGQSLYETPIIRSAIELLLLLTQPLQYENLGRFVHSPFTPGFNKEPKGRVELELKLRNTGQTEYWLSQIIQIAESITENEQPEASTASATPNDQPQQAFLFEDSFNESSLSDVNEVEGRQDESTTADVIGCPSLLTCIKTLKLADFPTRLLPSQWARWCYQLLEQSGWPGDRSCSSVEYQQIHQWYELLGNMLLFDDLSGEITLANALELIRKETQSAIFQPQTEDSQLQVLGPLEAAGLQFSNLWLMGLSDNQWPSAPAPNPLIPLGLQREHHMPHATAERELSFATDLINTFINNAENVIGSYPQWHEDQPLRPSGLVKHLPLMSVNQLDLEEQQPSSESPEIELIDTSLAPAVTEQEKPWVRGSSGLLKQQAMCPFTAFSQYRLAAYPLEEPTSGLSALDRGNLVHSILEYFWQTHKTQENLKELSHEQRLKSLQQCCKKAINRLNFFKNGKHQLWMGETFWQLESERLMGLVDRWLEQETHRSSFTVFATEDSFQTDLGGMTYKLRIDRIDQLPDGTHVLIDYKTGDTKPKQWFSERPQEPQLPLYAVACHKPVAAITFASVNAKQQSFAGLKAGEGYLAENIDQLTGNNSDAEDWQEQVLQWRDVLNNLSASFMHGYAAIDPLTPQTYSYSGLAPLARLYELTTLTGDEFTGGSDD